MRRPLYLVAIIALLSVHTPCSAQLPSNAWMARSLDSLDIVDGLNKTRSKDFSGRLALLQEWLRRAESKESPQDSIFARLLHRIGVLESQVGRNYSAAIRFTLGALQINTAGKAGSSIGAATTDLYNLGYFYDQITLFQSSIYYYDSAIRLAARTPDIHDVMLDSRVAKSYIFFRMGDYQKAMEESDLGLAVSRNKKDSIHVLYFLNERAQALFFQNEEEPARLDIEAAIGLARRFHKDFELASAFKTKAFILAKQRNFRGAELSFDSCIVERIRSNSPWQVAGDYNDFGNFYCDTLRAYGRASSCFSTGIGYALKQKDSMRMARIILNLGRNYFRQQRYMRAMDCYAQTMQYLKIGSGTDPLGDPTLAELVPIGNKELIQVLFSSKTELLLKMYEATDERKWLTACLKTARLNDSLIREIRHEQVREQSKLYWRQRTRAFFMVAMQACYFAGDPELAFYFMEESRSVLLQDKLNELGANALLPPGPAAKLENLQIGIVECQENLSKVSDTSRQYLALRMRLLAAKESLEQYVRSLERDHPNYYQYKYNDKTLSLAALKTFLAEKHQQFIDYFMEDTVSFALYVSPGETRFIRIRDKGEDVRTKQANMRNKQANVQEAIGRFIRNCSDENALGKDFSGFLVDANQLYRILVEPFHPPQGRVIICQENDLLPFEALSKSALAPDYLVHDYSFSYVYSARSLLTQFPDLPAKGDFFGVAPIHFGGDRVGGDGFGGDRGLPELRQSERALRQCSQYYQRSSLLIDEDASRRNFLGNLNDYTVTTILTHARADSSGDEPRLFLRDSMILLSELQLVNKAASKLIVLSACQTNAGMNLNGEGIFSLARGFSAAGIPSVAATQWEADEQAIYTITEKFNEFIAQGLNKDEALQKAKLFYIGLSGNGNKLPYYWADMILIGNADPVKFAPLLPWYRRPMVEVMAFVTAALLVVMLSLWVLLRRRRRK